MPTHFAVACAVIEREGRVLAARRSAGQSLAGKWEFPGGKLEPGETAAAALAREIREELALDVRVGAPLPPRDHDYGTFAITLVPFLCTLATDAEAHPREHDAVRWCTPVELTALEWAPADLPVLADYLARPASTVSSS
jgi:8-oxo-dGTP diphosphatase